jgi:hypothetical protein
VSHEAAERRHPAEATQTERYSTVVIWCRAFMVGFAKAELVPS